VPPLSLLSIIAVHQTRVVSGSTRPVFLPERGGVKNQLLLYFGGACALGGAPSSSRRSTEKQRLDRAFWH
jgi:hypothetical protein